MKSALAALFILMASEACAGQPDGRWVTVSSGDRGAPAYMVNIGSIHRRTMDHSQIPTGASILVYRAVGHRLDVEQFYTLVFDCRGHFMIWKHPETTDMIPGNSLISHIEDVACFSRED